MDINAENAELKRKVELLLDALKKVQHAWDTEVDAKSRWGHEVRYAIRVVEKKEETNEKLP